MATAEQARIHVAEINPLAQGKYEGWGCADCGRRFKKWQHLAMHITWKHSNTPYGSAFLSSAKAAGYLNIKRRLKQ